MLIELALVSGVLLGGLKSRRKKSINYKKLIKNMPETVSKVEKTPALSDEKEVNRNLIASTTLTGIAGIGALVSPWLSLATVPGFIYLSFPIFKRSYQLLKQRKVGVETILTAACLTAFSTGYIFLMGLTYVLYYIADKLILSIQNNASKDFIDVYKDYPQSAWLLVDNVEVETPIDKLQKNDTVVVHSSEAIPVDGVVIQGSASVDQHILTGESQLIEKGVGETVFASTLILSGQLHIQVEKAGEATMVARIGEILNTTTDYKSKTQLRAETMAEKTVLPTLLLTGITLPVMGASTAMCILQSHFSYRMRLIAPISTLSYFKLLSNNNILIKDGRSLDLLNDIDTIVFDKTGTLTQEQPHIGQIYCCAEYDENQVLAYAATAEQKQSHPIAKAIIHEAKQRCIILPTVDYADYKLGYGISIQLNKQSIHVGSERFMQQRNIPLSITLEEIKQQAYQKGSSIVMVAVNDHLVGMIELKPSLRPEAKAVIQQLQQSCKIKHLYILSGDQVAPTRQLAHELGIEGYFAETLPEQKANKIEQLQAEGKSVCFIGDGINDAIALKKAHVSISLKGGSSVATDTAQVVLMDGQLRQLPLLFESAKSFHSNINTGFLTLLIPSMVGMGGAIFLHFGLAQAILLTQAGLTAGVINGIRPRLKSLTTSTLKE